MEPEKLVYRTHRDRSSKVLPLKDAINAALKDYRIDTKFSHERIKQHWPEIMGETVAKRTEQLFVKEQKLYVRLSSAPLKQELQLRKAKVLERIHQFAGMGAIQDVVFL
jgi:hypothetical protein